MGSGKFEVTPQLVERGLRAQGAAVTAALAADPGALAAARLALRPRQRRGLLPGRPGSDSRGRLRPWCGVTVRVDADDFGPLALALLHGEVLLHARLLHAVQRLDVHDGAAAAALR